MTGPSRHPATPPPAQDRPAGIPGTPDPAETTSGPRRVPPAEARLYTAVHERLFPGHATFIAVDWIDDTGTGATVGQAVGWRCDACPWRIGITHPDDDGGSR